MTGTRVQIKQKLILWIVVTVALIGCQRAAVTPTETTRTQVRPSPTPVAAAPTPTSLPRIDANDLPTPPLVAPEIPRITIDELKALLSSPRNVLVIDTRDRDAYETAHIRDAINIPYEVVSTAARQLPRGAKIVLYCA
jgi:hypothetical protein